MTPLLELRDVCRDYPAGEQSLRVLDQINLSINAGEMVAIVGASGSGKSTLMNILGCLDRPSEGSYRVAGRETGALLPDELAELRREHFGFIFQRYHLLSNLDAIGNTEVPAIYAGKAREARQKRARALLERLGMGERLHHRPGELSGGQQQRVSIARALINGGQVILADEPSGALDSRSGQEVMKLLTDLHTEGHTVIIVTHDMQVAAHAKRIIEICDGLVVSDTRSRDCTASAALATTHKVETVAPAGGSWQATRDRLGEALRMSVLALISHRLRSFLTMLGIIIGIASVVSVVALGQGTRERVLKDISSMGTNTIEVYPGNGFGDQRSGAVRTLVPSDADALATQDYVDSVTPSVSSSLVARYGNIAASVRVSGVGTDYFRVRGLQIAEGGIFDKDSELRLAQEAVIDEGTRTKLFGKQQNVLGEIILLGKVPMRVIGVTQKQERGFGNNGNLNIWTPYTTAIGRITGQPYLQGITVRVRDGVSTTAAEQSIIKLLALRHGRRDVFTFNSDSLRKTIESTAAAMTLLVSLIAVISLIVGGIGVMNIMLVSVTERTREIGVRMAVGARQSDIMQQFLIEAVLVCLVGGVLGVVLAVAIGPIVGKFSTDFTMIYSTWSISAAFACSTVIGLVFGFMPARNAARLNPIEALSRE